MADEDITLDGKPLQSLRVADLKAALEQRNLPKSGQKNQLIKRLKGALMLENLQKSSSSHSGLQPNSQIGEEMCQNSFIKQYLAKQQELLRQRLEREAMQEEEHRRVLFLNIICKFYTIPGSGVSGIQVLRAPDSNYVVCKNGMYRSL
uniref:SAP domain-containing protein n=1 Tax=Amphiprion percula TaxID=161767 RepID=A0A3P8S2M6_AMPPE